MNDVNDDCLVEKYLVNKNVMALRWLPKAVVFVVMALRWLPKAVVFVVMALRWLPKAVVFVVCSFLYCCWIPRGLDLLAIFSW